MTHAFTAADVQDFEKLRGYLGEDNSDKNVGYSKSIYTIVRHTHTLMNLCQLSHLCTQTNKNPQQVHSGLRHEGGLDEVHLSGSFVVAGRL